MHFYKPPQYKVMTQAPGIIYFFLDKEYRCTLYTFKKIHKVHTASILDLFKTVDSAGFHLELISKINLRSSPPRYLEEVNVFNDEKI